MQILDRFQIDSLKIEVRTSLSDPDPKLIITDPDPANNFGSDRIRTHNTAWQNMEMDTEQFRNLQVSERYN